MSDKLDIQNLILREDHITKGYDILIEEIKNSKKKYTEEIKNAFVYDK